MGDTMTQSVIETNFDKTRKKLTEMRNCWCEITIEILLCIVQELRFPWNTIQKNFFFS